jgi:predicted alpha-1,2-mannosidase
MKKILLCAYIIAQAGSLFAQKDWTQYVNPLIGTGGHGHTFPGATMPFGMVQLSPDTRMDDWDGCSGYHYSDSTLYGFSHTHLSGTGVADYCDILLMPTQGKVDFEKTKTTFSHRNETAKAGYYKVKMDNGITAELTATPRVGLHRYTFPNQNRQLLIDLKWRDKVLDSELKMVGKNRIEGFRRSEGWARNQMLYFVIEFSDSIDAVHYNKSDVHAKDEKVLKVALDFIKTDQKTLLVKCAISAISIENARENLQTELPHWDFDKTKNDAKNAWNKELQQVEITDKNRENLTVFYTALYHTKLQPNVFQDVNGDYRGRDFKTHTAPKNTNFTVFSLWDTFRAAHPLYSILDKKRTTDFINTFIRQHEEGGRLPVWELAGNETECMIGYHSVSVIADAMAKGIKGFDYEKAFAAAKHAADLEHFGLTAYKKNGFISMEDENESVSKTLEYAYDDFCIAVMAKILHKTADYERFIQRAMAYQNLFDRQTNFMRPRQNGGFISPFKPNEVTFHFTEGNSWVYSFFVPQDVSGLMTLQGGKTDFAAKLDSLFTTKDALTGREQPDITGLIGQYAHGNEPSHHIAYLYNYAGQPQKTQRLISTILNDFYKPAPDGLIGNEDCGQMSAWYILSSMGLYQVAPSVPQYDFGSPIFKTVKINLESGKSFIIKTKNASKTNIYIQSLTLNGKPLHRTFLQHSEIENGGVLVFEMTDKPNTTWFIDFTTTEIQSDFLAVPIIDLSERIFTKQTTVTMRTNAKAAKIIYTTEETAPYSYQVYEKPFVVNETTTIKAFAQVAGQAEKQTQSNTVSAKALKLPHDWTVKLFSKYNRQYTGGGDIGLIDGLRGTENFASGEWQGYQSQDFIAVIDLKTETELHALGGSFLQVARSWIWMPTEITFETSSDGINFTKVTNLKTDVSPEEMTPTIREYKTNIPPTKARFVRINATNLGKIPAWHPGAGFDAFIFIDEVFLE